MKEKPNAVIINGTLITSDMIQTLQDLQNEGNSILLEFGDTLDEMLNDVIVSPVDRTPENERTIAQSVMCLKKILRVFRSSELDPDAIAVKIELTH